MGPVRRVYRTPPLAIRVAVAAAILLSAAVLVLVMAYVGGAGRKSLWQHLLDGTQPRGWRPER